jgi:CheY-like chemotaxis protein
MSKTILIVEDDDDLREIFTLALEQRGYHVLAAGRGSEGLDLALKWLPELIFLDVRLPLIDGWQVLRYLRTDERTESTLICAVSGFLSPSHLSRQSDWERFDSLLTKPVDPREIVRTAERMIGPPERVPDLSA